MSIQNLIEISRDSRISKEVRKDIIYKIGRAMDDSVGMNYTSDLRDELIKMVNSEKKNRTISLEAYLKMQNDWLMAVAKDDSEKKSRHRPDQLLAVSKGMVDAILKHNNVTVRE